MRRTHMKADCVKYRYLCFSHLHVHVMLKSFNLFWDPLGWNWLRGFEGMGTLYHGPQTPSQGKKQKKNSIPWVCTKTLQQKEQVPSTPARIRMSHVIWFQCSKTFWVPFVASKNGWRQMIHPIRLRPKLVKQRINTSQPRPHHKVQKVFNRFWRDQCPPNKETSRPEDNWTTIPYYSTRKLLWLASFEIGGSSWEGFVAYPDKLGEKFGRIQKTWPLAKSGSLIGGVNKSCMSCTDTICN